MGCFLLWATMVLVVVGGAPHKDTKINNLHYIKKNLNGKLCESSLMMIRVFCYFNFSNVIPFDKGY